MIALILDPKVRGFAGGLGSALADTASVYGFYAPATFVAKGSEGYIVGLISRFKPGISRRYYRFYR